MATSDEILSRVNESIDEVQAAKEKIVAAANTFAPIQALAEAALPKSGGTMTGGITRESISDATPEALMADNFIRLVSPDGNNTVSFGHEHLTDGVLSSRIQVNRKINDSWKYAALAVSQTEDGIAYARCPNPRDDNYGTDIVTMKALKDYAPQRLSGKYKTIHVWPSHASASDTADLYAGRGDEDKPFASLNAAIAWSQSALVGAGSEIVIMVHENMTIPATDIYASGVLALSIRGDVATRKLTLTGPVTLVNGALQYLQITLAGSGARTFAHANGNFGASRVVIGEGVTLQGSVTGAAFEATNGGEVFVVGTPTGSVSGKKYSCTNGGMINGASKIPGTKAGTADANSKAFG